MGKDTHGEEFLQAPSGASASYGSIGAVLGQLLFHSGQCAVGRKSCSHFFSNGGSFVCHVFIPAVPGAGYEVRGNGEMFPLNGPAWSLFSSISGISSTHCLFISFLPRH